MGKLIWTSVILFFFVSCSEKESQQVVGYNKPKSDRQVQMEVTSDMNKTFTEEDVQHIKNYLSHPDRNWDVKETGSGLYYYIFKANDSIHPVEGDKVLLEYEISLLDGTVCYSSEEDGEAVMLVDKDDVESGLHEAVKLMGVGDEAVFILHHSRAHGLLGDSEKIPPLQVVVYKLKLLDIL